MKITAISVWRLDLPLARPYRLSGGRLSYERLDSTIVRIDTDAGISGWGEGCPWGASYLPAFAGGLRAGLEQLAPILIGRDPRELDRLNRAMDVALPGHLYVKSTIDIACWDILGQAAGLPLAELLGGREADPISIASSISTATPEQMLAEVEDYRARGYKLHSCKVGADVALDIERIRHLDNHRSAGETMFWDANRAWLPHEAITVMRRVERTPGWFEQPCETLDEIAQVRRVACQLLCIDESLVTQNDLSRIQRDSIAEIVNIKLNRVGGLTRARRLRDFCLAHGIAMLVMDSGGTVLSDTAVAHLAQSIPAASCLGAWSCQDMLTFDPAPGRGARIVDGCFDTPTSPGLGVAPDLDLLGDPVAVYD